MRFCFWICFLFVVQVVSGDELWSAYQSLDKQQPRIVVPEAHRNVCVLDVAVLEQRLAAKGPVALSIPMPDGSFEQFNVFPSSLLHPDLAAKFPEIKVYAGGNAAGDTVRIDLTPTGFRAQVLSQHRTVYVDPYFTNDPTVVVSYDRKHYRRDTQWQCFAPVNDPRVQLRQQQQNFSSGDILRT